MIKKLLLAFVLIVGGIIVSAAIQPSHFSVAREVTINAPPEVIFPYINNAEKANSWMPWKESDPKMQMTFTGPTEGVGATANWNSEGDMGNGKSEVIESIPHTSVKTQLTYTKPMAMSQLAEMTLVPESGGTKVRWSVSGENSLIGRIFCLFMDMDKMVGTEFEKGLNRLKEIIEVPQS